MSVTLVFVCMHAALYVTEIGGKGTWVLVRTQVCQSWRERGRSLGNESKEKSSGRGDQLTFDPFSSSGQSQCAICVSMSSHCLDICPSFRNPT